MSYQEIIEVNKDIILNLYLAKNYKKSEIAYKLINDLNLDLTNSQVDSFRRAVNQFLQDWDQSQMQHLDSEGNIYQDTIKSVHPTTAKILFFDVETTYAIGYFFPPLYNIIVQPEHVLRDSHMICWSAQWLYDPEVFGDVITPEEMAAGNAERITKSLWKVMDEADIIIAHNGKDFDIKVANTHFIKYGLPLPSQYEVVDTNIIAKRTFRFASNALDYINRFLGLPTKIVTPKRLWVECMEGKPEALAKMFSYNKHDVEILVLNYLKLRPYIKGHPNMGFYVEGETIACPNCGSTKIHPLNKPYHTLLSEYTAYRCDDCGALGHSKKNITGPEKKKTIIAPDNR
jgi:uncharacterized protein YprB with RNaseH-like and TPR domain/predicted RNA-binding Zn-ribbon protein involved in translation (DUF1610 family)